MTLGMTDKTFFSYLARTTAGTVAALAALLAVLPQARAHTGFSGAILVLFILIGVGLYYAGKSAAGSSSKLAFNNLIAASVFGKMLLALAVLFIYQQATQPTDSWFVGIFLLVYVIYTVFEVWFMTKLSKGG